MSDTHRKTLAATRQTIAELAATLDSFDDAPLPKSEWKARALSWVDTIAERFEADAFHGINALRAAAPVPGGKTQLLADVVTSSISGTAHPVGADLAPALGWLLCDQLKTKLAEVIDARDYDEGPPLAERPQRKAELERQLHASEIKEEQTLRKLETATGTQHVRRADARPELVLAWDDDLVKMKEAANE
jgi:hypothetical protein